MWIVIGDEELLFRKVFLARRRDKDQQFYAVKVVKKTDVVNKNMMEQGEEQIFKGRLLYSPIFYYAHSCWIKETMV